MKLKPLFALACLTAALGLSSGVTAADAQGRRGGGAGGRGAGAAGGPGAAGPMNAMQLQMQMQMGGGANIVDPAVSAKSTLVYRPDVQNSLGLDLKQKIALDGLKEVQAQNQQKMAIGMRTLTQGLRGPGAQNLTADDQQKKMQDAIDQAKGMAQSFQDDMDKRIDAILTPKQQKRLGEIDLQWRGPLSMVDPKVAEQATLNAADKKKAVDAYKEFTDARQKLMLSMLPAGMRNRLATINAPAAGGAITDSASPPAAPNLPAVNLSPQDQAAAQRKALVEFNKSCIAMGVKLIADVTPPAATAWQEIIGTHFTFRNDN